jgi:hypothetical protein
MTMKLHFSIINAAVSCHNLRTFEEKMIYFQIFFSLNIFELFVTKNIEPNSLFLYGDNLQLFARRNHGNTSVGYIALVIKDWDFNMKRKDGEEYKENVVKTM